MGPKNGNNGHMLHRGLSQMHILVWGPSPIFYREAKVTILGKIFDKILNWWLTVSQQTQLCKIENNSVHR